MSSDDHARQLGLVQANIRRLEAESVLPMRRTPAELCLWKLHQSLFRVVQELIHSKGVVYDVAKVEKELEIQREGFEELRQLWGMAEDDS